MLLSPTITEFDLLKVFTKALLGLWNLSTFRKVGLILAVLRTTYFLYYASNP